MTDTTDPQITVSRSATGAMAATFARDALKVAGTTLVTKGIITASLLDQAIGLIIAVAPIAYSQLKTLWDHRRTVRLAESAPIGDVK